MQKNNNSFLTYRVFILFAAWLIYCVGGLLLYTSWTFTESGHINTFGIVLKASRYFVYFISLIAFCFFSKQKSHNIFTFIILAIFSGLTMIFSEDRYVVFIVLLVVVYYGLDEDRLLKISCLSSCIILFITVTFSKLGIIKDYVREDGDRVRHFLGFSWATYASILFFFIVLEYIVIKKGRINLKEYIVCMLFTLWFYSQTNARFALAMGVLSLTFFLVFGRKLRMIRKDKWYRVFLASPWVIAIGSILLHCAYNEHSKKWQSLNSLLSDRLHLGKMALTDYSVKLFGQPIEWFGFSMREQLRGEYNYVDCSYLQLLLQDGLVFLTILLIILTMIIWFAIKSKKYYLVWIILFMMVFCITEPWLISSLAINPFLLCVGAIGATRTGADPLTFGLKLKYAKFKFVLK